MLDQNDILTNKVSKFAQNYRIFLRFLRIQMSILWPHAQTNSRVSTLAYLKQFFVWRRITWKKTWLGFQNYTYGKNYEKLLKKLYFIVKKMITSKNVIIFYSSYTTNSLSLILCPKIFVYMFATQKSNLFFISSHLFWNSNLSLFLIFFWNFRLFFSTQFDHFEIIGRKLSLF